MKKNILVLLVFTFLSFYSFSQWIGQASLPYFLSTVYFVSNNTGYIGGVTWLSDTSIIYKTTDAGLNWTLNYYNFVGEIMDIDFISIDTGMAISFRGTILKTTNGGLNWSNSIIDNSIQFYSMDYISRDTCFIAGTKIYRTVDNGINWTVSYNDAITKIVFPSSKIGYGKGSNKTIKTTNSGSSWTLLNNFISWDIDFVNETVGYSVYRDTIRKTIDGGLTWESFTPFDTIGWYISIHALTENCIFAACTTSHNHIIQSNLIFHVRYHPLL